MQEINMENEDPFPCGSNRRIWNWKPSGYGRRATKRLVEKGPAKVDPSFCSKNDQQYGSRKCFNCYRCQR